MGSQKDATASLSFKKSLSISLLFHVTILGLLLFALPSDEIKRAAGVGDTEIISVSLIADGAARFRSSEETRIHFKAPSPLVGEGGGEGKIGYATGSSNQIGGEGGSSSILQQIRNQIERHKHYPLMAKRSRIEGSPQVEFKIKTDGALEYVSLKQSSGSKILDEAATLTVHQAAPYPFYPEPIALNIHYSLAP